MADRLPIGPAVTFTLPYELALRLSYMARFPKPERDDDLIVGETIDAAIEQAEAVSEERNG